MHFPSAGLKTPMFLKKSPEPTLADRRYTVCVRHGNAWTTEEWTHEQWRTWLEALTPRQLVHHMAQWQEYAERMPALRRDFDAVLADARTTLTEQECALSL
jgi:hypothetical protein